MVVRNPITKSEPADFIRVFLHQIEKRQRNFISFFAAFYFLAAFSRRTDDAFDIEQFKRHSTVKTALRIFRDQEKFRRFTLKNEACLRFVNFENVLRVGGGESQKTDE